MRSRSKLEKLLSIVVAGILAVTGLVAWGSNAGAGGPDAPFVIALANDPVNVSPAGRGAGNDMWSVTRQMYDSLVYANPDTGEIEPWLATSWEVSDDATEYTFHLRDDVTFSDGLPLDAEAVKANLDDLKAAGPAASAASALGAYVGTDVVDPHTVVVRFDLPQVAFLAEASSVTMGLISPESLKIPFEQRASGEGVFGSGAFTLEEYKKDSYVTMRRRDDYAWAPERLAAAQQGEEGAGQLAQRLQFIVIPEGGNRTGGILSGEFNAATIMPHDEPVLEEGPNYLVSRPNPGVSFGAYLNDESPLMGERAVRLAVAHVIDREQIREGALSPRFNVATSPLSSTTRGYADVTEAFPDHDPDAARRLLDDAGWRPGPDGIREKDGERLELRIAYSSVFPPSREAVTLLQQQLADVGIAIVQRTGTPADFGAAITSGEFELSWVNLSNIDGDVLRGYFGEIGSSINYPVPVPEIQAALKEQAAITDPDRRAQALRTLQEDLVKDGWTLPVFELTTTYGVRGDCVGVSLAADSRLDVLLNAGWR